ncbi:MAG: hypothetical protein ACU0CO_06760 [Shimia sp.]
MTDRKDRDDTPRDTDTPQTPDEDTATDERKRKNIRGEEQIERDRGPGPGFRDVPGA